MISDVLEHGRMVKDLASKIRDAEKHLDALPGLARAVIEREAWRAFWDGGRPNGYASLAALLASWGWNSDARRRRAEGLLRRDPEVQRLWRQAIVASRPLEPLGGDLRARWPELVENNRRVHRLIYTLCDADEDMRHAAHWIREVIGRAAWREYLEDEAVRRFAAFADFIAHLQLERRQVERLLRDNAETLRLWREETTLCA